MPKANRTTGPEKFKKTGKKNEDKRVADHHEDYDQLFQLAVNQEEQGERYQFGAKARRNYEQSIESYRLSIELISRNPSDRSPSDGFNSHFNLARVLVNFGSTFASAPSESLKFVEQGIQEYRLAVEYAIKDSDRSDEIDARYNLASALSTSAEILSAGQDLNSGPLDYHSMSIQVWKQAKEELSRAYQLQEELLLSDSSQNLGPSTSLDQEQDMTNLDPAQEENQAASSPPNGQTTLVEEVFVITPSVLIDTLMDICEVLLSIYSSEPEAVSGELQQTIQQLGSVNQLIQNSSGSSFSRQFEIDSLICNIDLTIIDHTLSESCDNTPGSPNLMLEIAQKLATVNQRLEDLSTQTSALDQDFLNLLGLANNYSCLCTATCSLVAIRSKLNKTPIPEIEIEELKCLIERSMSLYSTILEKLKHSKLRPIKQIKPHEISSYISSSLVGQSELTMIVELLEQQQQQQGKNLKCLSNQRKSSFDLAIEAYNQSLGAYQISRHSSPTSSFKLAFTPVGLAHPTNSARDQSSGIVRNEWANLAVRLESIKLLLRSKYIHLLHLSSNSPQLHSQADLEQISKDHLLPLIHKFQLSRSELARFYDDFLNDPVFILSGSVEQPLFDSLLRLDPSLDTS
ncbi:hypothetical protein PGT21_007570 [Puccinia graminis f. sp. tritici]|uniref:Uncharacterized protein n=1 Tax=Puccinia graminis f. sp. tritici TaxID=56615 RepID=A0A5B0N211_PUCGR|nr:hypothetical protein PGT21_007570 [Puccinia graminis f. sp. tritici]KAA1133520.1 hypothetical protein PGTUg99_021362 [Puccinia graminis f. sp. tritici]